MPGAVRDVVGDRVPLVDHHVHGVVTGELDRPAFELLISESGAPAPLGTTHFDAPVGLAVRRWCAPLLGLEPHATPEAYLARRAELGAGEVNHLLASAAALDLLFLETGHRSAEIATPAEMAGFAGAETLEVVRVEVLAEAAAQRVADGGGDAASWLAVLGDSMEEAAREAVGFKTIVAYRCGFDLPAERPPRRVLTGAFDAWLAGHAPGAPLRLDAPALVAEVLHRAFEVAAAHGLPIQVHAGFGDTDLDLHRADPVVFTPWVRHANRHGVPLVFLHCYPYHRQAGYLAEAFANVYFDVGCILNYAGPSARQVLAEALELAPFTKMLYSSDAFGVAELLYLGADQFRRSLSAILAGFVDADECTEEDARRFARLIGAENARRVYPTERARRHGPGTAAPIAGGHP